MQYVIGLITALPDSTSPSAGGAIHFDVPTISDDIVEIPVYISEPGNLLSLEMNFNYNKDCLELESITYPQNLNSAMIADNSLKNESEVKVVASASGEIPLNGEIVSLRFRIKNKLKSINNAKIYLSKYRINEMGTISKIDSLNIGEFVTNQDEIGTEPTAFRLYSNYPNPFNPTTTIKYNIPSSSNSQSLFVKLTIFDALGAEVETLVNGQKMPGNYTVKFDASNLPSGIYYYRLIAGNNTETKKMIYLK